MEICQNLVKRNLTQIKDMCQSLRITAIETMQLKKTQHNSKQPVEKKTSAYQSFFLLHCRHYVFEQGGLTKMASVMKHVVQVHRATNVKL